MYAVIESGGKQHRVTPGEVLDIEKLDVTPGATVDFDRVLMVADGGDIKLGAPYVAGGKVTAEVVSQGRGDKVKIIKFRRRKHHMKQMGHRQWFTRIKITGISAG
jgi:large subunit ribosomal protein L21